MQRRWTVVISHVIRYLIVLTYLSSSIFNITKLAAMIVMCDILETWGTVLLIAATRVFLDAACLYYTTVCIKADSRFNSGLYSGSSPPLRLKDKEVVFVGISCR